MLRLGGHRPGQEVISSVPSAQVSRWWCQDADPRDGAGGRAPPGPPRPPARPARQPGPGARQGEILVSTNTAGLARLSSPPGVVG